MVKCPRAAPSNILPLCKSVKFKKRGQYILFKGDYLYLAKLICQVQIMIFSPLVDFLLAEPGSMESSSRLVWVRKKVN